ncbi:MAG: Endoribonuclease YbeY [Planctomycetota bacterium]|jgi:probable rRNA maturation factor
MAFEIDIRNDQSLLPVDHAAIRRAVAVTLREEHVRAAVISITLVDNAAIHRINREHLQHDYPTDVISFQLEFLPDEDGTIVEGEIIASAEMAVQMAPDCGWPAASELLLYIVHGLLHLCGYDDLTPPDKAVMRSREQHVLGTIGLKPVYPQD